MSLVIEAACPERENAANENHAAAEAPDDDTLSVGPDMPDLPLDAPPNPETSAPPASTAETSAPVEVQPAEKEEAEATADEEQGTMEEESTVREEPQVEQEEGTLAEQQEENNGAEGEEGGREERQQEEEEDGQRAESAPQAEEEVTLAEKQVGEETEPKADSDTPAGVTTNAEAGTVEAPTEGNIRSQEAAVVPAEAAPQEVTEGGERSCVPCTCQSLFSNYNSHAPSRRKNRPCSLPVSELETVIASACGEPETPRSHYIRIHHLLHSLPSAQQRAPSQEEEEETREGENTSITQDTTSTSPTLKTSKEEEGQEEEDEEDTTQSPSQVQPALARWVE